MIQETNSENINFISEIKNRFDDILNILRYSPVRDLDCNFLLFLLLLKKEGLFQDNSSYQLYLNKRNTLNKKILIFLDRYSFKNKDEYKQVHNIFFEAIEHIPEEIIEQIIRIFESFSETMLRDNIVEIFEDWAYKSSKNQGGTNFPIELNKFVLMVSELPKNADVYNPFARSAFFYSMLGQDVNYIGQEWNKETWAVGKLRMLAYDRNVTSEFTLEDSIENWNPTRVYPIWKFDDFLKHPRDKKKFNLIISFPPLGLKLRGYKQGMFGEIKTIEHFLIEKGLEDLKDNGKLIAVIPNGFLFRMGGEQYLREYLVEKDLLDMIIAFPEGMLTGTRIPFTIIIINKNKNERGFVRFLDAKDFVEKSKPREKILNCIALNDFIKNNIESEFFKKIRNSEIASFTYNLNVARYFLKENPIETKINDAGKFINGERIVESCTGKFIRFKDLKKDRFNNTLTLSEVQSIKIPKSALKITESCILFNSRGQNLCPTVFNFTGEPIFIIPEMFAFKVNETLVDSNYFINELYTDYVIEQLEHYKIGSTMSYLRREDLLNVKFKLPPLSEQLAKVQGAREAYIQSRNKQLQLEKDLLGFKTEAFREFASIKHTFSQYLNALKSNVGATRKFFIKNEAEKITIDSVISKNLNITLGEHLENLEEIIDSMTKLISTNEESGINDSTPQEIDIRELLKYVQGKCLRPEIFEFELLTDEESFKLEEGGFIKPIVKMSKTAFLRMFSNIVSNATEHGFKDSKKKNKIRIFLAYNPEKNYCEIDISNNGLPMPNEFTYNNLVTRGEKTITSKGSGIGGADIKDILENYHGKFALIKQENEEFPVTYIISLPLIKVDEDI